MNRRSINISKTYFIIQIFIWIFSSYTFGQGYFQRMQTSQKKYFITGGYGIGTARWNSTITNSELYDKNGRVIRSGFLRMKARNSSSMIDIGAMVPVQRVRMGLGIAFEEFVLTSVDLQSSSNIDPNKTTSIVFDEAFKFSKIFAQIEVPFDYESDKLYSFNFNARAGYYGYSGIRRMNFFGIESLTQSFLLAAGVLADFRAYPHTYIYLFPHAEFKYFNNSRSENPSDIIHKILTGTVVLGVRLDMSKE